MWANHGEYRIPPDRNDADAYLQEVAYDDLAQSTKGKIEETLKRYYRWIAQKFNRAEWEPEFAFQSGGGPQPGDFLTVEERRKSRQAAPNRVALHPLLFAGYALTKSASGRDRAMRSPQTLAVTFAYLLLA